MSATWSLTYLETSIGAREIFDIVVEIFQQELGGKLYGLDSLDGNVLPIKLNEPVVEWFTEAKRAKIVSDSYFERLSTGVLLYPPQNRLFVLVDNIVNLAVYESGRTRREDLKHRLQENPDPHSEMLFHYLRFLTHLTTVLKCHAAYIMFDRNPAGRATSIYFYDSGMKVEDYYYEHIEAIGSQLIELPNNPEQLSRLLGGRFVFLKKQPRMDGVGEDEYARYFDGEDLSPRHHTPEWDVFGLQDTDLFVPFWDENTLPLGAVYCLKEPLPDYFLKRYET